MREEGENLSVKLHRELLCFVETTRTFEKEINGKKK
jgi:hypothetical protein